jgi:hypothetical protein
MKVETDIEICEDTLDKLVLNKRGIYECACGEQIIHGMRMYSNLENPNSYKYTFTCDCGNRITVLVKDIHANC